MTRQEHEARRSILAKLQARIAEDPFFRLYELGVEAGQLLLSTEERTSELQRNYREARELICRCRACGSPVLLPPPNCDCSL